MCSLEKKGNIFHLTLTGDGEHRLSPTVISSLLSALSQVRSEAVRGSVLVTSSHGRFFSNGFDLAWAQSGGSFSDRLHHMVESFSGVISALISLPMPTVASLPGHAAAAGLLLALSHDHVTMRSDRGVLYMSEVDIGLSLPLYFSSLLRAKIGSVAARRDLVLQGAKVRGEDAVRMGIVDSAHPSAEEALQAALARANTLATRNWDGQVYAEIRKSLYPELCGMLGLETKVIATPRL